MIPLATQGTQALDRYAYTNNNPLRYKDPSGHWIESALDAAFIGYDIYDISQNGLNWENGLSLAADVAGLILPAITGGGLIVRAAMHADDVGDAARATKKILSLSDDAVDFGRKLVDNLGEQTHHLVSDKNGRWTSIFKEVTSKYSGLDLDGMWNKIDILHKGRHPKEYHVWIDSALRAIDAKAKGDSKIFLELFDKYVGNVVEENPWLLKKAWWENYGEDFWELWYSLLDKGLQ